MAEKGDVSNTTIAVLLILTIIVLVVSTWTVVESANQKNTDIKASFEEANAVNAPNEKAGADAKDTGKTDYKTES